MLSIHPTNQLYIGTIQEEDAEDLAFILNNYAIYQYTLHIPYPYTLEDAQQWITVSTTTNSEYAYPVLFSLYDEHKKIIGGIGYHDITHDEAEIGY